MPVAVADVAIVKRKGDDKVKSVEDLGGLNIGGPVPPVGTHLRPHQLQRGVEGGGKGSPDRRISRAIRSSSSRSETAQIDGAVETRLVINELMRKQPDQFEIVGTIGKPFYIGWVVRPNDTSLRDCINEEIWKIRDSGEMAKLQEKWFGYSMKIPDAGYLPPNSK